MSLLSQNNIVCSAKYLCKAISHSSLQALIPKSLVPDNRLAKNKLSLNLSVKKQITTYAPVCSSIPRPMQMSRLKVRAAQSSYQKLVPPEQQNSAQNLKQNTAAGWFAALSLIALATALILENRYLRRQEQAPDEIQDEFMHKDGVASKEYQTVLTSVRQVVTLRQAVQSMRSGDNARAMVELHRVLEQNAICRTPLNTGNFSKDDLEDMYRLHLQNSELPLQYSTLLHLRQLFGLGTQRAEELETDLKASLHRHTYCAKELDAQTINNVPGC